MWLGTLQIQSLALQNERDPLTTMVLLSKISLSEIRMFQGRSVRIRIIKQKEQRYERNKRQKHRTAF